MFFCKYRIAAFTEFINGIFSPPHSSATYSAHSILPQYHWLSVDFRQFSPTTSSALFFALLQISLNWRLSMSLIAERNRRYPSIILLCLHLTRSSSQSNHSKYFSILLDSQLSERIFFAVAALPNALCRLSRIGTQERFSKSFLRYRTFGSSALG